MQQAVTDLLRAGGGHQAFKRPILVSARQIASQETVQTREGPVVADPGEWVLGDDEGNLWPVSDAHLREFYAPEKTREAHTSPVWRAKPVEVRVAQLEKAMSLTVGPHKCSIGGEAGDWLIYYGHDSFGIVAKSLFHKLYRFGWDKGETIS